MNPTTKLTDAEIIGQKHAERYLKTLDYRRDVVRVSTKQTAWFNPAVECCACEESIDLAAEPTTIMRFIKAHVACRDYQNEIAEE